MRCVHRQQLGRLLKLSCNLAGESQLFDWLGSARLCETKPMAQLSSKKKPGQLRRLDSRLAPAPGAAATLPLTKSASSTTKPSSGTTVHQHFRKKSSYKFNKGIELDFYPGFSCRKPKLKWNLMKFDFSQQDLSDINLFTPIVKNTPIHSTPPSGKPLSRTTNLRLSTQPSTPSPLLNPTPKVKNPSIRPNLSEFRLCQIISTFKFITGTALIPLQTLPWREPLKLVPLYLNTNNPENSSLHPQLPPSIVVVESIFVTVITTDNQELLLLCPISFSGIHKSLANP